MTEPAPPQTSAILSCMRNESPFLLEWVAYHSLLGFDRIYVATNDCTDGTDLMLERLQELGYVTHIRNPMEEGLGPQQSALRYFMANDDIRALDWVLHIDADEFLNIRAGQGRIDDLLSIAEPGDALALMWRPFGDSGRTRWNGEPILPTFTASQARPRLPNAQHKTLFRPNRFGAAIDHMPKSPLTEDVVLLNSAGVACNNVALYHPLQSRYRFPGEHLSWENAYINHYAIRSHDIFLMKNNRGDGMGRKSNKYYLNSKFYNRQNKNGAQDASILRHQDALSQRLSSLMADPILSFLHVQATQSFMRLRDKILTPDRIAEWTVPSAA